MKSFYQRFMICSSCRLEERQTANILPLDYTALKMAYQHQVDFLRRHKCKSKIVFSEWKRINYNV